MGIRMDIEELNLKECTDDELRQQYSLTLKIQMYYLNEFKKSASTPYKLLAEYAKKDIDCILAEYSKRNLVPPTIDCNTSEFQEDAGATDKDSDADTDADTDAEKNEPESSSDMDSPPSSDNGQVSYQTPIVINKLSE